MNRSFFILFIAILNVVGCKKEQSGYHTEIISDIPVGDTLLIDINDKYSWGMMKSPYKSTSATPVNVNYKIRAYYSKSVNSNIPITITITDTDGTIAESRTENGSTTVSIGD